ncbi:hypothetical protein [Alkaliphilus metalliredigens]|nr:hypothetical protein [Alkaliphilus metalliredigens]
MHEMFYKIFNKTGNIEAYLYWRFSQDLQRENEGDHEMSEVESFQSQNESKVL